MNILRTFFHKHYNIIIPLFFIGLMSSCNPTNSRAESEGVSNHTENKKSIKLALLLDTSNSMDGLIDQAKSQLWKIVNELAEAKADGVAPTVEIALYEYGNDGLSALSGYVRQVAPMTDDLDLISEKLFSLRTNGGSEYCGKVIKTSLEDLDWKDPEKENLKMIFIAGNEPFSQGPVNFRTACGLAKEKDVIINTIFCGDFNQGINISWKDGAELTDGEYMSIEQDKKTVYIETPYDQQINQLNTQLNNTYIYYGDQGARKKQSQIQQDNNAATYGASNKVDRAISKSKHVYKNESWDLVEAAEEDENVFEEVKSETLPAEMQSMSTEERKIYVLQKKEEREKIKGEINELSKLRSKHIESNLTKEDKEGSLDNVMLKAIKEKAKTKNFDFDK